MTSHNAPPFNASITPTSVSVPVHWYSGTFKETSTGIFKAVYRSFRNIITQNRNLT